MINLPSKSRVKIEPCGFEDACDLKDIVGKNLAESNINIDSIDVKDLDVGILLSAILKVDSSKEFRKQAFKCLERSLHNDEKITPQTFDPAEFRGDYYPILVECLKVNVLPFFYPLASMWKDLSPMIPRQKNQEQKSQPQNQT